MRKIIKKLFSRFEYEIIKVKRSESFDAFEYNEKKNVNDFYNSEKKVSNYHNKQRINSYVELLEESNLKSLNNDINILDAGCGPGFFSNFLFENTKFKNITGLDFSDKAIEIAINNNSKINYKVVDLMAKTLKTKYDLIFSISVLEHLECPEQMLGNLISYLNPNGKLIIVVPDGRKDSFFGHIHFWSLQSWILLLRKFENIKFSTKLLTVKHDILTIIKV